MDRTPQRYANRCLPLMAHWADAGNVHPEALFATLVQMAGELATFTAPDKRAAAYPAYRHDDLQRSFAPVVSDLRRSLSAVLETTAVAIPLQEPKFGIRVGPITDRNLLRASQFVLAVSADIPGLQFCVPRGDCWLWPTVEMVTPLVNRFGPHKPIVSGPSWLCVLVTRI